MIEFTPHPFQERAISDLVADPFHALFMKPGLGKTAIVLETFCQLYQMLDVVRALVIAPMRVCYSTWPDEAEKWRQFNELRVCNLHEYQDLTRLPEANLYLINPESMHRLFGEPNEKGTRWVPGPWKNWRGRPEMLIVDELTRFKKKTGVRAKMLKRYLGDFGRRVGMTGTSAPNGLQDLHGQMLVIDRGEALDWRVGEFRKKFFIQVYDDDNRPIWEPRATAAKEIAALIAPRVTYLEAGDYLQLPKRIVTQVPVILPGDAMQQYKQMRSTGVVVLDDVEVMTGSDSSIGKCRQIANGMVYTAAPWESHREYKIVHLAKIEALKDLIAEIGGPVMVIYEFRHEAEVIERAIPGVVRIGGGTSPAEGKRIEDAWNRGEIPVLLTHPASGGVGLNLQRGSNAQIWFTPPWDLEQFIQTVGRLERQGQLEPNVFVYFLVARGTVDPRVARVLERKEATQDELDNALKEEMGNV